jgi:hypothetical protein
MKKHTILISSFFACILALVAGCQTGPKVSSEFNPEMDFSGYKTFVILPLPSSIPGGDPGMVLRTGRFVEQAVIDNLTAKGFQQSDPETADFAVNLTGQVVPKLDITDMGYTVAPARGWYGYYQPYAYNMGVDVDQYDEGTLIIEVYDVATKEMSWVGWGVARRKSEAPDMEKVSAAVDSILADFPPEK